MINKTLKWVSSEIVQGLWLGNYTQGTPKRFLPDIFPKTPSVEKFTILCHMPLIIRDFEIRSDNLKFFKKKI